MPLETAEKAEQRMRERLVTLSEYRAHCGEGAFTSFWLDVDQTMIDIFADATHDWQFIHVDPARAKAETPFGGTIAHGFLTLSLLSVLAYDALPGVAGTKMGVNVGFDKVRFVSPVKVGSKVRGVFQMTALKERAVSIQTSWNAVIEIEGSAKPALTADWITLAIFDEPPA